MNGSICNPPTFFGLPVRLHPPACRGPDLSCYLADGRLFAWLMTERAAEELFGAAGLAELREAGRVMAERWEMGERARG